MVQSNAITILSKRMTLYLGHPKSDLKIPSGLDGKMRGRIQRLMRFISGASGKHYGVSPEAGEFYSRSERICFPFGKCAKRNGCRDGLPVQLEAGVTTSPAIKA